MMGRDISSLEILKCFLYILSRTTENLLSELTGPYLQTNLMPFLWDESKSLINIFLT